VIRVLAFPFHGWRKNQVEGFRTRDAHVLEHLARSERVERVVVVDRPLSAAELLSRRGGIPAGTRIAERRRGVRLGRITQVGENVFTIDVLTPDVVRPIRQRRGWWFEAAAHPDVLGLIEWATGALGMEGSPAIAWVPAVEPIVRRLQPSRLVFDSLDNWLIHPALRGHADMARMAYAHLLPRADCVFASAPASANALAQYADKVYVLPNGVDVQAFDVRGAGRPADVPPGPVVGYAGKLARRVDDGLVAEVAGLLPRVQFVFVGPVLEPGAVRSLRHVRNVHLLGDRNYRDLPAYLHAFDLGWIPHRVGEGETGGDPIKLYEYWAAGLHVVSTAIDGLVERPGLHLVRDARHAASAISHLMDAPPTLVPSVPADRTWAAITEQLLRALEGSHDV
jgi:glycosyltransferase involved in cell wall biosynthesis